MSWGLESLTAKQDNPPWTQITGTNRVKETQKSYYLIINSFTPWSHILNKMLFFFSFLEILLKIFRHKKVFFHSETLDVQWPQNSFIIFNPFIFVTFKTLTLIHFNKDVLCDRSAQSRSYWWSFRKYCRHMLLPIKPIHFNSHIFLAPLLYTSIQNPVQSLPLSPI